MWRAPGTFYAFADNPRAGLGVRGDYALRPKPSHDAASPIVFITEFDFKIRRVAAAGDYTAVILETGAIYLTGYAALEVERPSAQGSWHGSSAHPIEDDNESVAVARSSALIQLVYNPPQPYCIRPAWYAYALACGERAMLFACTDRVPTADFYPGGGREAGAVVTARVYLHGDLDARQPRRRPDRFHVVHRPLREVFLEGQHRMRLVTCLAVAGGSAAFVAEQKYIYLLGEMAISILMFRPAIGGVRPPAESNRERVQRVATDGTNACAVFLEMPTGGEARRVFDLRDEDEADSQYQSKLSPSMSPSSMVALLLPCSIRSWTGSRSRLAVLAYARARSEV